MDCRRLLPLGFSLLGLLLIVAPLAPAATIHKVSPGLGYAADEAENFDRRTDRFEDESNFDRWTVQTAPVSGDFSNASNGQFIQAIRTGSPTVAGFAIVEYFFRVPDYHKVAGQEFRVWLRGEGYDTGSDSVRVQVYSMDESFNLISHQLGSSGQDVFFGGSGQFDTGTWASNNATNAFTLNAGLYSVRVRLRETDAAVDKVVLQLASNAAPMDEGPKTPEPGSALLLGAAAVVVFARRRRMHTVH